MRIQINWNAVTAVCAIVVAVFTTSGWLTDGLREDIRKLRLEMHEGFAEIHEDLSEIRKDIKVLQQDMAFIKGRTRSDQTTNGNTQRTDTEKKRNSS